VALVEKDNSLGGTCLDVGCIPSKALLHLHRSLPARRASARSARLRRRRGSSPSTSPRCSPTRTRSSPSSTSAFGALLKKRNVEVVRQGLRRLVKSGQVHSCAPPPAHRTLETKNILIATGSVPVELPFTAVRRRDRHLLRPRHLAEVRPRRRWSSSATGGEIRPRARFRLGPP
jgi:dihydrolipoamide dehydrogenase